MKIKCDNIHWDLHIHEDAFPKGFYSVEQILDALPTTIILELPDKEYDDYEIATFLTDLTGILIEDYHWEILATNEPATKFVPIGSWHQEGCPTNRFRTNTKYVCQ